MDINHENLSVRQVKRWQEEWIFLLPGSIMLFLGPSLFLGFKLAEIILSKTYDKFQQFLDGVCTPELASIVGSACYQGSYSTYSGIYVLLCCLACIFFMLFIFLLLGMIFQYSKRKTRRSAIWLLYKNSKKIGSVIISLAPNHYCLGEIVVDPKFQNRGYGSYFLETVIQEGFRPIYVLPIARALSFYMRLGFRYATIEEFPSRFPSRYLGRLMVYGLDKMSEDLESDRL